MATTILIEATTEAHEVDNLTFSAAYGNVIGIVTADLVNDEVIKIRAYHPARDGDDKFVDITVLDATHLAKDIYLSALTYVVEKPITVNSVGVSLASNTRTGV